MKKYIMLVIMLTASAIVFAQHPHGKRDPKAAANHQTEKMKSVLNLSDQQYASIKKINDNYAEKAVEMRKDSSQERTAGKEKMRSFHQDRRKEINAILTADQQEKWKSYREEQHQNRKAKHQSRKDDHLKELQSSLSLTDEQMSKLKDEHDAFKKEMKAIHHDSSLSEESKKEKVKSTRVNYEKNVQGIMTPDQFVKWKSMKEAHREDKGNPRHEGAQPKK